MTDDPAAGFKLAWNHLRVFRLTPGRADLIGADDEYNVTYPGGFYGHFASKADLAVEACTTALIDNVSAFAPKDHDGNAEPLAAVIDSYLSPEHRNNVGNGCVLAALGSDAGRSPLALRHAFAEGLQAYIGAIAQTIPGRSMSEKRQKAVATMAGLVGAMVLARAVDDPSLSHEILRATSPALRSL